MIGLTQFLEIIQIPNNKLFQSLLSLGKNMYDKINLIKFDPPRITSQNRCIHKLTGIDACAHPHCWTHTHVYLVGLYERDNWLHWAASGSKERENKGLRSAMVSVRSLNVSSCIITCCEDCPKNCRSLAKCLVSTYKIDFPGGSASKESACSAGDLGSVPGLGKSPGEGNGNPLK